MNYQETCEYLYHQMPMFERQGATGYKEGLSNTWTLDEHFGHPHQQYATIHVGGTNGKGSVSHTLAAFLQECGYRVGLYTSPHLVDFRERIRVNGEMIPEEYVINFVEQERGFFEPLSPSFFEVTTALAFKYFADKKIDVAVIEVGLGGRLDCTNIITPLVSVITNISFDHTQFLGDTLAKIASEKAGIIKKGVPVVIGETHEETRPVFEKKAQETGSDILFADDNPEVLNATPLANGKMHYTTRHWGEIEGELGGIYQEKNLNTVFAVLKVLSRKGFLSACSTPQSHEQFRKELADALAHVCKLTGLTGRWQVVSEAPLTICDTGHNVGGWTYLSQQIAQVECAKRHIVFGMVEDKDINQVLDMLPKDACYYFTQAATKRAINGSVVKTMAAQHGLSGECYPTVVEAYRAAKEAATLKDFIFIGGSSYLVGDFLKKCI
ncbi:folylpolyglutamate synthase/dihydrofolate synthase family protein [Prevotella sp. tf2-5]|uniref:bifunctional folylpolyglutamate synthase/dihydrofolate synthase n=1 Tax=Prevotella sp. tf2-5 TaxID=1761889 RepID=UPI0008EF667E|nr:folylpolyglutamate synthase/dihydrofolate synthase family protein [Prevotella sp. tf2-5]SFO85399.1 dihydrofolate synthase / folylpolyglutamate synthase [Prevotella sp. tf2-5]